MLAIIIDPSFSNGIWGINMLNGLVSCLKQKRIAHEIINELSQLSDNTHYVFIIGADTTWIRCALEGINALGRYPILLCNQAEQILEYKYSTVCSDVRDCMNSVISRLRASGKNRFALYGVNTQSIADCSRMESFVSAVGEDANDIFYNNGSMAECYESFFKHRNDFDAVICANSFLSVSLVRRLRRDDPDILSRIIVIGFQEIMLTEYYADDIRSLRLNFLEYGHAAVTLMECLKKDDSLSHITMYIKWSVHELQMSDSTAPVTAQAIALPDSHDSFYEDPELNEMMLVEKIFCACEGPDMTIIKCMLQKMSSERIAEVCNLGISTTKYRIRRLCELCGLKNKSEIIKLLRNYL